MIPHEPWLKPLDAQVRQALRQSMIQQDDGKTIILRPKQGPTRQRLENPVMLTFSSSSTTTTSTSTTSTSTTSTTTTTSTSTTTTPPTTTTTTTSAPFSITLINGTGGFVSSFDTIPTNTSITIPGVFAGTHSLEATPDAGFNFLNWSSTTGIIANPTNASTTIDLVSGATIQSNFIAI